MPRLVESKELGYLKLRGTRNDDGSALSLRDDPDIQEHDLIAETMAEISRQTSEMNDSFSSMSALMERSMASMAQIVNSQAASIRMLSEAMKQQQAAAKVAESAPKEPREYTFSASKPDGKNWKITAKEVEK